MYLTDELYQEWAQDVATVCNGRDGCVITAEHKGEGPEVMLMGDYGAMIETMAALVVAVGREYSEHAHRHFDDVMNDICEAWEKIRERGGVMKDRDGTVTDTKTGFGYNEDTGTVYLPPIPAEAQEHMLAFARESAERFGPVKEKLETVEGVIELFGDAIKAHWDELKIYNDEKVGKGVEFSCGSGVRVRWFEQQPDDVVFYMDGIGGEAGLGASLDKIDGSAMTQVIGNFLQMLESNHADADAIQ